MIGIFNDCFPPIMDGVSLTTQNYARWLHKKTGNVCVITPKCPGYRDEETYPVYRYSSIPIPMRKPYRIGLPRMDLPFYTMINQQPFELVHAHCPFSSGALAMQIARSQNIPIIATFHSKYRTDFEQAIPNKYLVNHLLKNVISFYEQADEVWIPQASVEETLREYGYKGKVEIVDNGNDFADGTPVEPIRKEARRELCLQKEEFAFLFVGQHIREKNINFLIRSLSMIRELPFRMYFIGTGYAEKEMKLLVEKSGLSSKVTFVGCLTDRNELKKYYAAADLFLFPSLYDNAPLVVREAAAMHTPSLLVEGSTAAQIIEDTQNGFLSANSPEAFAGKIRGLVSSPFLLHSAGLGASQSIARSWEDVVGEVVDRYTRLIERTSKIPATAYGKLYEAV